MEKSVFFNQIKAEYAAKKAGIPILTESALRLEQFITPTTTQYTFPVLANAVGNGGISVNATEVRLEQNDNFHISHIGFYLAVTAASTDTAFRLQTNPNEIFLGGAAPALDYFNIYNGLMKINVNQVDVLTNYRLSKHLFVGQTQRLSAAVNNNFDEFNAKQDALIGLHPSIMLSGAYTNTITISLPGAVTAALAANNSRMVIIFDGLRAQNAAIRRGSLNS